MRIPKKINLLASDHIERPAYKGDLFLNVVKLYGMSQSKEAKCHDMDFWIGDWNVHSNRSGKLIARSKISISPDHCTLIEDWSNVLGFKSTSSVIYSREQKVWRYVWIDSTGEITTYTGVSNGRQIVFLTQPGFAQNIKTRIVRMTLTKKSVEELLQKGEESFDNMASWDLLYDLTYKRRQE